MADAPFEFLPLGAILQSFKVKGTNIVQGFPTQELYEKHNSPYFGVTVGRVANRLESAQIKSLNGGQTYKLAANDGPNNLHGGIKPWSKRVWNGPKPVGTREIPGVEGLKGGESIEFSLVSEDGDEGFPGTVKVTVVYTAGTQEVDGKEVSVLGMEYEAQLVDGADETAINMTNHSYFNLTGDETFAGTIATLATNAHLPRDSVGIPTGGPVPFPGIEGGKPFELGVDGPAVDDCFIVNEKPDSVPIDTRKEPLKLHVHAKHPKNGVNLEVLSTEPAFQFYTGEGIDVPAVEGAPARGKRSGFCVEPSRWVNAINVPEWKNQMLLKKGETYGTRIVYKAWSE
ncbi:Bifunctional protein GAL10-like protein 2 [Colletotrichum truncatum]|uniref:Bifunctional protein GAL10-like protein 2 n=1 Tax=Colletotrichum truncatum TaxID=5467 RepID=A0ACC3Z6K6_COLTU|nr:Bifunctional protein GAL10-like protein 2 [Colletotrichum truncatum]KAF6788012.1 Bifunctional protein GAL10-like protein 2 [Colletotrichum truncatum]